MKLIGTAGIQVKWRCDRSCNRNLSNFQVKICNGLNFDYNCDDHISISSVFSHFKSTSSHVSFLLGVKVNSIKWSAANIMGNHSLILEHCSSNAEAIGSNTVEAQFFFEHRRANAIRFESC